MNALAYILPPSSSPLERDGDASFRLRLDTERGGPLATALDRRQTWPDRPAVQVDYSDLPGAQQAARQMCFAVADVLRLARRDEPPARIPGSAIMVAHDAVRWAAEPGCYADLGSARRTAREMRQAILSLRRLSPQELSATGAAAPTS